jgi:hypothetical protein
MNELNTFKTILGSIVHITIMITKSEKNIICGINFKHFVPLFYSCFGGPIIFYLLIGLLYLPLGIVLKLSSLYSMSLIFYFILMSPYSAIMLSVRSLLFSSEFSKKSFSKSSIITNWEFSNSSS